MASATGSTDPDGSGTVSYAYAWYEDGVLSSASTSASFPSSATTKHHTYRVVVTPSDGTGDGPTGEAERTVDNTAPVLSGPTLSASTVQVGDVLTCAATATDADAAELARQAEQIAKDSFVATRFQRNCFQKLQKKNPGQKTLAPPDVGSFSQSVFKYPSPRRNDILYYTVIQCYF